MWMVLRRGLLVLAAALCWAMARRIGFWPTLGGWALLTAIVVTMTALLLRTAGVGQMGWKNYLAGFVLQFGYAIARGKLAGIAVTSWLVWVLIGLAAALAAAPGTTPAASPTATPVASGGPSTLASILLMLAWVADGGAILYIVGVIAKNFQLGSSQARRLLTLVGILLLLIVASIVVWQWGYTYTAALVAGGPGLLLAGFFGIYVLIILTAGRNARWN